MEVRLEPVSRVRCADCHAVYEPAPQSPNGTVAGCPWCGGSAWLAVSVPVPDPVPKAGE